MSIKKQQQTPISDTQVEHIIEAAASEERDSMVNDGDVFGDIPIVDDLYEQDEYWTEAIDLKILAEHQFSDSTPWNIDVREDELIEHNMGSTLIELDTEEIQYDEESQVILKYADQYDW